MRNAGITAEPCFCPRKILHGVALTGVDLRAESRRVPPEIKTAPFTIHEFAREYDPVRQVAVLLWPPRFDADLRPHPLRLDVAMLCS